MSKAKNSLASLAIALSIGSVAWGQIPKFGFVANSGAKTLSRYSIDPDSGHLSSLGDTVLPTYHAQAPIAVVVDSSNGFLYALHSQSGIEPPPGQISEFQIGGDGSLTFIDSIDTGTGAVAMALATLPTGRFVYTVATDVGGLPSLSNLWVYRVEANGTLTSVEDPVLLPDGLEPRSLAVAVTPSSHFFLYVGTVGTKSDDKNLLTYRIGPDGRLTRVYHGSPYPAERRSWSLAVHPSGQFVFVANANCIDELESCSSGKPGSVSAYRRDPNTGQLTEIPGSPFAADFGTRLLTIHPNGRFLYTANFGNRFSLPDGSISGYSIDEQTGALTPLSGFPLQTGRHPWGITFHPTRDFLYVTNIEQVYTTKGTVSGFAVDPNSGALAELTSLGSPWPVEWTPKGLVASPTGAFLYVTNDGNRTILPSAISGFRVDLDTGGLTPLVGSPFPSGLNPRTPAVDPSGQQLYVPNDNVEAEEADPTSFADISVYTINPESGALTEIAQSPFLTGGSPDCVAVHPTGMFVYGTADSHHRVWGYLRNAGTGTIAPLPSSPFRTGREPLAIALDPTGTHAYVANSSLHGSSPDGSVSAYSIDPGSGALTEIDPAASAGYDPVSMAADFTGGFLYAADRGSDSGPILPGNLFAYTIDDLLGFPTQVQVLVEDNPKPSVVTTHPTHAYAYAAFDPQSGNGNAQGYAVAADGSLSSVGSPVPLGQHPSSGTVEVSGKFLYFANGGSNSVSQCLINSDDGSLSPNGSVATGPAPRSIATSSGG